MRVLCTGGQGSLGKNLQEYIENHFDDFEEKYPESKWFFVGRGKYINGKVGLRQGYEYDLTDIECAKNLFADYSPDVVLHLAANCGGIGLNKKIPATLGRDNLLMGINVLEAAKLFGTKYVYLVGTCCSFPSDIPVPFKEDDLFNGLSEPTNRCYSDAKKMIFSLHDAYRKQFGLKGAKLIPANLYGLNDHFDLESSHVIPALIRKFIEAKKENKPFVECWGTGTAEREFLNFEDASRALYLAIKNSLDTELPINVGTGKSILIKDLAVLIGELVGYAGEIVFNGAVSDGQMRRRLDVSRAKEMLGFEAQISLRDGLKNTIEWYQSGI
jgi:GDP-L-fucose synthase